MFYRVLNTTLLRKYILKVSCKIYCCVVGGLNDKDITAVSFVSALMSVQNLQGKARTRPVYVVSDLDY